ncbi:hypothetical protein OfM2_13950 [Lactovum odontotermitis]
MIEGNPKTYFLQGSWGSGKTEYLNNVKGYFDKFKFIELRLWESKDKTSLAKKLFSATLPEVSKIMTGLGGVFIGISIIGSIFLAVKSFIPGLRVQNEIPLSITTVAVILTTLYEFLQRKWLDINRLFMHCSLRALRSGKKPKILVIDDFDRLDAELQKELYMVFNAVHEKTRVIFVGDLQKVYKDEANYLGKIIDQKVALPYSLHPSNVARKIQAALSTVIKENFDFAVIRKLFTEENHTARDANQFLMYVENEFINNNKVGKVQTAQQLFIIYLYLFHPTEYQMLLGGWPSTEKQNLDELTAYFGGRKNDLNNSDVNMEAESLPQTLIMESMNSVLQPRNDNPVDYRKSPSIYFVNEMANNHSMMELMDIINSDDGETLEELFKGKNSQPKLYDEFLDFISRMRDEEYKNSQAALEKVAILAMKSEVRHVPNQLVKLVFEKRSSFASERYWETDSTTEVLSYFDNMFDEVEGVQVGVTEKMYYYRACLNLLGRKVYMGNGVFSRDTPMIDEKNVANYFSETAKETELNSTFGSSNYDAEALIVQLGYSYWLDSHFNRTKNPDFKSKVDSIEKLDYSEYKAFWNLYGVSPTGNGLGETILSGGSIFEFEYKGREYWKTILERLIHQN